MITVVSWRWKQRGGREFLPEYVNTHKAMVARHLKQEHRYICITDDPTGIEGETFPIWGDCDELKNLSGNPMPSCYRRLKLFDGATTDAMGIARGDRVVSMDLDVVVVAELDPLFDRPEDFVGWRVQGGKHSSVFNGTLFMQRADTMSYVWNTFHPKNSPWAARHAGYYGTDQAWISYLLAPSAAGWSRKDGVLSYNQDCRLTGNLPAHTRLVSFHGGNHKPWIKRVQDESPWIRDYWN